MIRPTVGMTTATVGSSFAQCTFKDPFDSPGAAHRAMTTAMLYCSRYDRARFNVYLCPHCFSYHFGKRREVGE